MEKQGHTNAAAAGDQAGTFGRRRWRGTEGRRGGLSPNDALDIAREYHVEGVPLRLIAARRRLNVGAVARVLGVGGAS